MILGINFADPSVQAALAIIACLLTLAALMPPFDSTDDDNWGDDHSNED